MKTERREITAYEYENAEPWEIAERCGYPEIAYGLYRPRKYTENDKFYMVWERGESAD